MFHILTYYFNPSAKRNNAAGTNLVHVSFCISDKLFVGSVFRSGMQF